MAAVKSITEKRRQLKGLRAGIAAVNSGLAEVQAQIDRLYRKKQTLQKEKERLEAEASHLEKACSQPDVNLKRSDFGWSERLHSLGASKFGIKAFRPYQEEVMNATMSGRDAILVMPTGGGKSLCFQLPALLTTGFTLVVSPLVSLMEDQAMSLQASGIPATLLSGSTSRDHVKSVHRDMVEPGGSGLKLLYVTPEKIAKSKRFMAQLQKAYEKGRLSRIAIDEVHCCSQWGHDFRPDYKVLGILKRQFPRSPILGLTATASSSVLEDVKSILSIPGCDVFRASYNRANLYYEVRPKPVGKEFVNMLEKMLKGEFANQSGIIYCFSRKDTETLAEELTARGILAAAYHAYVEPEQRSQVHRNWKRGHIQVVIATTAFGMGIDKPDVRFVVHHSLSKSMENYYQESGRAGRDDQSAKCILFFGFVDVFRQSTMVVMEQTGLEKLYQMVAYCISTARCRRSLLGEHFDGATWQDGMECNRMCDTCDNGSPDKERDVTTITKKILQIIRESGSKDQRLTGLKLIDLLGKSHQSKGSKKLSKPEYGHIILHLLLEGYLKEDFHFTAYTTISYMCPGPRADRAHSEPKITVPAWAPPTGPSRKLDQGGGISRGENRMGMTAGTDEVIVLDDGSDADSDIIDCDESSPKSAEVVAGKASAASQGKNANVPQPHSTCQHSRKDNADSLLNSSHDQTSLSKNVQAPGKKPKVVVKVNKNGRIARKASPSKVTKKPKAASESSTGSPATPRLGKPVLKCSKSIPRETNVSRDHGDGSKLKRKAVKQKRKLDQSMSNRANCKRSKQNQKPSEIGTNSAPVALVKSLIPGERTAKNASIARAAASPGLGSASSGRSNRYMHDDSNSGVQVMKNPAEKGRMRKRVETVGAMGKRTKKNSLLEDDGVGEKVERGTGRDGAGSKVKVHPPCRTTPNRLSSDGMDNSNVSDAADIASVYIEQLSSLERDYSSNNGSVSEQEASQVDVNGVRSSNRGGTARKHDSRGGRKCAVSDYERTPPKQSHSDNCPNPSSSSEDEGGLGNDGEEFPPSSQTSDVTSHECDFDEDSMPQDSKEMKELAEIYSEQLLSLGE